MTFKVGSKGKDSSDPSAPPDKTSSFGVKSYLDQFYQTGSGERYGGGQYLLPQRGGSRSRVGLYVCRGITLLGLLLFLIGATGIVVGYTWPRPTLDQAIEKIGYYEDAKGKIWIPKQSIPNLLLDPMRGWKLCSLGVFALGGVLLAVSLIVPTCANTFATTALAAFASEMNTPCEAPIQIYPHNTQASKVPVTAEVSAVQPKLKENEKQGELYLIEDEQ